MKPEHTLHISLSQIERLHLHSISLCGWWHAVERRNSITQDNQTLSSVLERVVLLDEAVNQLLN